VNSRGGINGHPVKVDYYDDAGDPGKSAAAFQRLATEHVLAVIDGTTLDQAWAASAVANGIPVICGTDNANAFTCSSNPDFFPSGGTVLPELYGDYAATKAAGATTTGIIYCTENVACKQALPVSAAFVKDLGMQESPPLAASSSAPSYTAQCVTFASEKVQAVWSYVGTSKVASDCARQGYRPMWIEASGTWQNRYITDPNLRAATLVGTIDEVPWVVDTPATKTFLEAVGNLINTAYSPYSVETTWAAGLVFQAAAANAGNSPTSRTILAALNSFKDQTLGGFSPPLTFISGKAHSVPYYYYLQIKNGKWVAPDGSQLQESPIFSSS
jgi:branched-chain amino acid transport system substrate-binding protein